LDRADALRTGRERTARSTLDQLDSLAVQLEGDGETGATSRDRTRLRALAATLRGISARLR
jgi:hypothetical protein